MCDFAGKIVTPTADLKSGENNDGDMLFKKDSEYTVLSFLPEKMCFILINDKKVFDVIHISNFKVVE